jgi:signal-transduction protein with cAMP-binding, CBS, and nucleotidyltransferase domain
LSRVRKSLTFCFPWPQKTASQKRDSSLRRPGKRPRKIRQKAENRIAIFSKLVQDFMRDMPLAVPMGTSLADTARRMEAEQAASATVTDGQVRPTGIVIERTLPAASPSGYMSIPPPPT